MIKIHRPFQRYELYGKGSELTVDLNTASRVINRMAHTFVDQDVEPIYFFNRAVKRGQTVLITGDKPRFALIRHFRENRQDPLHNKLGDGAVRVTVDGVSEYLHDVNNIKTHFTESGTNYEIHLQKIPELTVQMTVSQMEDFGAAVKIQVNNTAKEDRTATIRVDYGGICTHGRTYTGAYFFLENDNYENNFVTLSQQEAILENTKIPEKIKVWCVPEAALSRENGRAVFEQKMAIPAKGTGQFSVFVSRLAGSEKHPTDVDTVIAEARDHAEKLVAEIEVSTPDEILNAAFLTSVYNMEYIWNGDAWLEGLHWWMAPWAQNYQLSAAMALGQYERVKKVIDLIGHVEPCPAPGLTGDFKAMTQHIGVYTHGIDDGLPYYLYQVCQYYEVTHDKDTLLGIWEPLCRGIDTFFEIRSDENGLVDFHFGCNLFLYQADHISLPGNAASPTLFMAGMLERMVEVALHLEKAEQAVLWKQKSEQLYQNLSLLWNREDESFCSHIDRQGVRHMAHYYTDLVFPMLYTSLPDWMKKKSLDKMFDTIMFETEDGRPLMRSGEQKPDIFGNKHVGPTQMCEAARALYMAGENEIATRMMQSMAYAATVYTESPGGFPERTDDDGKGEPNYIFGNPTASFCYTFVSGLFGIDLLDGGKTLRCVPAFPYEWDHASLKLPYASLVFNRTRSEKEIVECYKITSKEARMLKFRTSPDTFAVYEIDLNGKKGQSKEQFGAAWCEVCSAERGTEFTVIIRCSTERVKPLEHCGNLQNYFPCETEKRLFDCRSMQMIPLPLDAEFKDNIRVQSAWRWHPYIPDLSLYLTGENRAEIEGIPFIIKNMSVNGGFSPGMVVVQYGFSDSYTNRITREGESRVEIPLKGRGNMLALLYISECQSRNTGCKGGAVIIKYTDGSEEYTPLIVGKTLDTIFSHFAEDTFKVYLPSELEKHPIHPGKDYANLYLLPVRSEKELECITFSIELADVYLGVMGITLVG